MLGIIDGTILANRTSVTIKFFVEGQIQELASLRSVGLNLPRASAVLNLYNCDAATPETEEDCFWDPYMVDRDGFYEIVPGIGGVSGTNLMLKAVGGPEGAAIWIQNHSSQPEIVVYRNNEFNLLPGALREFAVGEDALPTFFVRSCVEVGGEGACEWIPVVADSGLRYALVELETSSGLPDSRVSMLELLPLDNDGNVIVESVEAPETTDAGESAETETLVEAPARPIGQAISCTLLVPTLNVRSGPGLEYEIIAKVRGSDESAATVLIIGRDITGEWLAVDELVAPGGWITGSPNFAACEGNIADLAIAEITDGRLAPTPEPEVIGEITDETTQTDNADVGEDGVEGAEEETTAAEELATQAIEVPKGQGLLIVNNGFDQQLRFTLDQKYRVEPGPSEYDLEPGQSAQIFVYPGLVGFSASTAWRGLSDNKDFFIEEEESRELWLFFMPDPDGSGRWILQY